MAEKRRAKVLDADIPEHAEGCTRRRYASDPGLGNGCTLACYPKLRPWELAQRAFARRISAALKRVPDVVPPPPDYSTPAAVSSRCREAGSGDCLPTGSGTYPPFARALARARETLNG